MATDYVQKKKHNAEYYVTNTVTFITTPVILTYGSTGRLASLTRLILNKLKVLLYFTTYSVDTTFFSTNHLPE
jgi:hypothetical protein